MDETVICEKFNRLIRRLRVHSGGQMRSKKGSSIEAFPKTLLRYVWCVILDQDPRRLRINSNKIPYSFCEKSGIKYRQHKKTNQGIGLDLFVYIDGRLVMAGESKAYLDTSMLKRAYSEFESLYFLDPSLNLFVFQAENSIGGEIEQFPTLSYPHPAFSESTIGFVDNKRRINPNCQFNFDVITLLGNKRNGSKKKEFSLRESPVDETRLSQIISYFLDGLTKYANN